MWFGVAVRFNSMPLNNTLFPIDLTNWLYLNLRRKPITNAKLLLPLHLYLSLFQSHLERPRESCVHLQEIVHRSSGIAVLRSRRHHCRDDCWRRLRHLATVVQVFKVVLDIGGPVDNHVRSYVLHWLGSDAGTRRTGSGAGRRRAIYRSGCIHELRRISIGVWFRGWKCEQ